jgi:membrane fusion protein (multidrug efflux system)
MKLRDVFAVSWGLSLLVACQRPPSENPAQTVQRIAVVDLWTMKSETIQPTLQKSVRIRSRVDQLLSAESSGVVQARLVLEGFSAAAGEPLLRLDGAVEAAVVSASEAEWRAVATRPSSSAEREGARARFVEAEDRLRRRTVRAPLACRLETWLVQEGAWVNPGTPVARIQDPQRLFATAALLEDEIGLVRTGLECQLNAASLRNGPIEVRACRIGGMPTSGPGQYDFEVEWQGSVGLLPGMVASLTIPVGEPLPELRLPAAAIHDQFGVSSVWVAHPGPQGVVATARAIRVAPVLGRADLVTARSGLNDGDQIVVRGALGLREGDLLRAEPTPP